MKTRNMKYEWMAVAWEKNYKRAKENNPVAPSRRFLKLDFKIFCPSQKRRNEIEYLSIYRGSR